MDNFNHSGLVSLAICLCGVTSVCSAQQAGSDHPLSHAKASKTISSALAPSKILPPGAIEVLDPGVDPKGEPRAILRKAGTDSEGFTVEVPETVHIHRYFPAGTCEFQAQYFAGGPTIVCARHPYSYEMVYVHIELAAGYPKVRYEDDKIEYKYTEESFSIHFEKCGGVTTCHNQCGEVKQKVKHTAEHLHATARDWSNRLGFDKIAEQVTKEVHETTAGTTNRARQFVTQSGKLFIGALNLVPGIQLLQSKAEDVATRERDMAVRKVADERLKLEQEVRANH